jgi:hypothetical protein
MSSNSEYLNNINALKDAKNICTDNMLKELEDLEKELNSYNKAKEMRIDTTKQRTVDYYLSELKGNRLRQEAKIKEIKEEYEAKLQYQITKINAHHDNCDRDINDRLEKINPNIIPSLAICKKIDRINELKKLKELRDTLTQQIKNMISNEEILRKQKIDTSKVEVVPEKVFTPSPPKIWEPSEEALAQDAELEQKRRENRNQMVSECLQQGVPIPKHWSPMLANGLPEPVKVKKPMKQNLTPQQRFLNSLCHSDRMDYEAMSQDDKDAYIKKNIRDVNSELAPGVTVYPKPIVEDE